MRWLEISLPGFADQLASFAGQQQQQSSGIFASITKQLTEQAATLLSNNDPAKADQIRATFGNILESTDALNKQIQAQGAAATEGLKKTTAQLYEQTITAAKNVATQLDESNKAQGVQRWLN